MTATSLHFAHVTDAHISEKGDSWATLGERGPRLLRECFARLNQIDDLDFVLITGDVLDLATPGELQQFVDALGTLRKPWHFVPGNHDGFIHEANPTAFRPAEAIPRIDPRLADPPPEANRSYWSRAVKPGVRLIGLDSRIADDWAGVIEPSQLDWLRGELAAHPDDLVLVAIHHPIHPLGPHNRQPWWENFIVQNGQAVERLLDEHSHVKMVISGHHHANQIAQRNGRIHLSTAALTGYPCVYRTVRLMGNGSQWRAHIETHGAADDDTLDLARALMLESETARRFDSGNPAAWVAFCVGRPADRRFEGLIADQHVS
jgi:3',5'-cyclic AMP phosphodiesterase CpdA